MNTYIVIAYDPDTGREAGRSHPVDQDAAGNLASRCWRAGLPCLLQQVEHHHIVVIPEEKFFVECPERN